MDNSATDQNDKENYINLNPEFPTMRGILKLLKQNNLTRLTSWENTPIYKISKQLFTVLSHIYLMQDTKPELH
jgi:hypothetical protein